MKVREYREKAKLTQSYVADKLGISQQAYSKKEIGDRGFNAKELLLLERILKVTFAEMFGDLLKDK